MSSTVKLDSSASRRPCSAANASTQQACTRDRRGCHSPEPWPAGVPIDPRQAVGATRRSGGRGGLTSCATGGYPAGRQRFDPIGRCVGDESAFLTLDRRRCRTCLSSAARRRRFAARRHLPRRLAGEQRPDPPPSPGLGVERPRVRAPQFPLRPPLSARSFRLCRLLATRLSSAMRACLRGRGAWRGGSRGAPLRYGFRSDGFFRTQLGGPATEVSNRLLTQVKVRDLSQIFSSVRPRRKSPGSPGLIPDFLFSSAPREITRKSGIDPRFSDFIT